MRGRKDSQVTMLAFVDLEARVLQDHPLRTIKAVEEQQARRIAWSIIESAQWR